MKEHTVKKWLGQAGCAATARMTLALSKPKILKAAGILLRFALGFGLSQAVIFEMYAPFGLAAVAAGGGTANGLSSLFGAMLGYFLAPEGVDGLKYVAAGVLIYSSVFIFRDTRAARSNVFMPAAAAAVTACVGLVFVIERGFLTQDVVLYIAEIILVAGGTYFYRLALAADIPPAKEQVPSHSLRRVVGVLVMASTLLIPLSRVVLPFGVSVGRILAVTLVLMAAYSGGMGAGSSSGVCMGLAVDTVFGQPFFSMAYGFAGLLSGVLSGAGRLACAAGYVGATAAAVLLPGPGGVHIGVVYETFAAGMIFMLMPDRYTERFRQLTSVEQENSGRVHAVHAHMHAGKRLEQLSGALRELYDTLTSTFDTLSKSNDADTASVFDRAANKVCRKCALASMCWDREALDTYNALNDLTGNMLSMGKLTPSDFPPHFTARCINLRAFTAAVNEELAALLYRRQYKSRLRESRNMVCAQYGELSQVIGCFAEEFSGEPGFDLEAERRLEKYLKAQNIKAAVAVYRDTAGRACAEIEGDDLSPLVEKRTATKRAVSEVLGLRVNEPEQQRGIFGERLIITEAAPLGAVMGVAAHRKKGQCVSGDSWTYFKNDSGMLYVLLSDGMGTGKEAAVESGMVLRLLERFLRAGVLPATAIKTLNSALILKAEDDCAPVTLDLMSVDLFSGEITLYKCGAAPTYIKKGRKLTRFASQTLPAGTSLPGQPQMDVRHARLGAGDLIVMASDGIASVQDDLWIYQLLEQSELSDPKELSCLIMEEAVKHYGRSDDMTVLVLGMKKRGSDKARSEQAV